MGNSIARERKKKKTRAIISKLNVDRLTVNKSNMHIYAQIISPEGKVLASASSLERIVRDDQLIKESKGKIEKAKLVGKLIAERGKDKITKVAFDRSGFKYHGRIKALADTAREFGLIF